MSPYKYLTLKTAQKMFTRHPKTSTDLNPAQSIGTAEIMQEVRQHGFYSAYCAHLIGDIADHDALISAIEHLAALAQLRVTFNAEESICIFEAY